VTDEEHTIAVVQNVARIDDLIMIEELALVAWQGECGRREQQVRIMALKRSRDALMSRIVIGEAK